MAPQVSPDSGSLQNRPGSLNRLSGEKSPYLSQHAGNPVDWYPWSEEAFCKAAKEDKPIFLSIGYATCHWCHVMAHESFEDAEVARLLNESFVSVKVDREERPDIDQIYMTACQMMTGSGGWPLSLFLTPDKRPFFAATYIPRTSRYGNTGMLELLPRIASLWRERRNDLNASADQVSSTLITSLVKSGSGPEPGSINLTEAYEDLLLRFDPEYGGFGNAPKFPMPCLLMFLLRYWKRTGSERALNLVTKTLDAIRKGGIYDHIGGGVHRYSTDDKWRVPHFEKMLYDQALCAMAYLEAFQASGSPPYKETAEEIISYILRDLQSPEGAFCAAEDADSGGREGGFYLWDAAELTQLLGDRDAALAKLVFNVTDEGNYTDPHGSGNGNVLYRTDFRNSPGGGSDVPSEDPGFRIESIRRRLFASRQNRPRPLRDTKVLADWNGLAIAALSKAAQVIKKPEYAAAAERAASFILAKMRSPDGGLYHSFCCDEAAIDGFSDDYAGMIYGLIELYEATFDERHLASALALNTYLIRHFEDKENGGFFKTSDTSETLLVRTKEVYDGVVPSSNSLIFFNLLRLSRLTGNTDYEITASKLSRAFGNTLQENPSAHSFFLIALDYATANTTEVVIAGRQDDNSARQMIDACRSAYFPSLIVMLYDEERLQMISWHDRDMTGYRQIGGRATAYVCTDKVCLEPINDPEQLRKVVYKTSKNIRPTPDSPTEK